MRAPLTKRERKKLAGIARRLERVALAAWELFVMLPLPKRPQAAARRVALLVDVRNLARRYQRQIEAAK